MANKNTKQLRRQIQAATRKGQDSVTIKRPVFNYHSHSGSKESAFVSVTFPTARVKGGVNSVNRARNSCQRLYLNQNAHSITQSLTAHEALDDKQPIVFPNHRNYKNWEYRRAS